MLSYYLHTLYALHVTHRRRTQRDAGCAPQDASWERLHIRTPPKLPYEQIVVESGNNLDIVNVCFRQADAKHTVMAIITIIITITTTISITIVMIIMFTTIIIISMIGPRTPGPRPAASRSSRGETS